MHVNIGWHGKVRDARVFQTLCFIKAAVTVHSYPTGPVLLVELMCHCYPMGPSISSTSVAYETLPGQCKYYSSRMQLQLLSE